jgi:hypothetical protein
VTSLRGPEALWSALEAQAAEDDAIDASMREVTAMSDAALDGELEEAGFEPGELASRATALHGDAVRRASGHLVVTRRQGSVATELRAERAAAERRKQVVPASLLIAFGAAAAVTGIVVYETMRTRAPQQAPSAVPSAPPDARLVAARHLRQRASEACESGFMRECLVLLDTAKAEDPAGDEAPDVKALRAKALQGTETPP